MSDGDLLYVPDETDGLLGRNVVWHDPLNRNYPIRALIGAPPLVARTWEGPLAWDQDRTSSCTAQAAAGVKSTDPFRTSTDQWYDDYDERIILYEQAKWEDPWPGQDYDGSSTDAPFKVLRVRGYIREWRWCFGVDDVLATLSAHGPVAIGVNWYEEMMALDAEGYLNPTGRVVGGHAVRLDAIDPDVETVEGTNSWGDWGFAGRFRLRFEVLDRLLSEQGEAVTVVP